LLDARFADEAVAAVDLHSEARDFHGGVGEERLDDRRQERDQVFRTLARLSVGVHVRAVDLAAGQEAQYAAALDECLLGEQHAAHVRVDDDRVGLLGRHLGTGQRAALQAVIGVGDGRLPGELRQSMPLQANAEARVVHHREHARQALVCLAEQPAPRIVKCMTQVGEAWMPILCSMEPHLTPFAAAEAAILVGQHLRYHEQADALGARRGVRQPRQYQVDDVVGQVVLAGADEDLGARDCVRPVGQRLGLGAQDAQVAARVRLREAHGARPLAGDHLRQVALLDFLGAVRLDGQRGALGQTPSTSSRPCCPTPASR